MLTRALWFYASAAIAIVCLLGTPVLADVTVIGDRSAYDEVAAAFKKLFSLSGFRAKGANAKGSGPVFEFAAPNSWHMGVPGGPYEQIHVDGKVAVRMSLPGQPAGWRCKDARGDRPPFDPTRATGTYNVSRGPDTVIDGTPVHTIHWKDGDKRTTYYVGTQNGLPKRAMTEKDTIDYYDYGAHVVITLPPCPQ